MEIELPKCPLSLSNALRRTLLADVVTIGPTTVRIDRNSSLVPNEILAHVIGLAAFLNARVGDVARLSKRNTSDTLTTVVTVKDVVTPDYISTHCPYPDFPAVLAYLAPGQEVDVSVTFGEGTGGQHARFCPVRTCVVKQKNEGCLFCADGCGIADVEKAFVNSIDLVLQGLTNVELQLCNINSGAGMTATSAKRGRETAS
jgi:hypothetical protein